MEGAIFIAVKNSNYKLNLTVKHCAFLHAYYKLIAVFIPIYYKIPQAHDNGY